MQDRIETESKVCKYLFILLSDPVVCAYYEIHINLAFNYNLYIHKAVFYHIRDNHLYTHTFDKIFLYDKGRLGSVYKTVSLCTKYSQVCNWQYFNKHVIFLFNYRLFIKGI